MSRISGGARRNLRGGTTARHLDLITRCSSQEESPAVGPGPFSFRRPAMGFRLRPHQP